MLSRSVTQQYPEVKPDLPPRSRGVIALVEENCTSCMLCARECPDWCIYIDSHKETLPAPEGGRPRQRNVLDRFAIDFSLCMYCGICIEVCPFDALFWAPEFEYAEGDIRNLLHEKDRLGEWVSSVPAPPRHEANAEPPKEVTASKRPARGPSTGGAAKPAPADTEGPGEAKPRPARDVRAIRPPGRLPDQGAGDESSSSGEAKPRPARDVRSIRPPGRLPDRTPGEETPAPADEEPPAKPRAPRDVRSIRPPGRLPERPDGGGERPDEEGP
ncbi:4Fe-4S dicluster domain-containing protein [Herbidospora galbida]|uniref:4Fe-4S dicluster domain-containing protein n=1 Tax=Herbidospora galbida TaxID=2575442 RepID=A0A4U3MEI7_9ACTN|nr:4Fe-4S binding protein [Herbidospora galbida]TKK86792.1 4Fe-4S dicluster domain-containing protein [Herbidospora galbida]